MCTVLLPLGVNPIAVKKYITSRNIFGPHVLGRKCQRSRRSM